MAMVDDKVSRQQAIATALAAELQRQQIDAHGLDLDSLANAVELALAPPPPVAEGKRPGDLNSANDD